MIVDKNIRKDFSMISVVQMGSRRETLVHRLPSSLDMSLAEIVYSSVIVFFYLAIYLADRCRSAFPPESLPL